MAYSEQLVDRIAQIFYDKNVNVDGKIFMGGYCFFLDEKMCVGLDIDKRTGEDRLMARVGAENMEKALDMSGCREMDITGRPMKGFVFVEPDGFAKDKDLDFWIQMCIDYNPFAKSSKKKVRNK